MVLRLSASSSSRDFKNLSIRRRFGADVALVWDVEGVGDLGCPRGVHIGLNDGSDANSVLLVGGSSRVPMVATLLADRLGVPVLVDTHP